jgi:hypothetical protein
MSSAEALQIYALVLALMGPQWTYAPLGIPPADDDATILRTAPEETLMFYAWAPRAAGREDSLNIYDRLAVHPDVVKLVQAVEQTIDRALTQAMPEELRKEKLELWHWITTEPGAIGWTDIAKIDGEMVPSMYFIVRLGETGKHIPELFRKYVAVVHEQEFQQVVVGDLPCWMLSFDEHGGMIVAFVDGYAVVQIGHEPDKALVRLVQRMREGQPAAWLGRLSEQVPIPRRATLFYANLREILHRTTATAEEAALMEVLGLHTLSTLMGATGLDDHGYSFKVRLTVQGEPAGIVKLLSGPPLSKNDLAHIPYNSTFAAALRLDFRAAWDDVFSRLQKFSPEVAQEAAAELADWEGETGVRIRDGILSMLEGTAYSYIRPDEVLSTGHLVVAVPLRDSVLAQRLYKEKVLPAIESSLPRGQSLYRQETDGNTIYGLLSGILIFPAWAVTDREILLALYPPSIVEHLRERDQGRQFADRPQIAALLQDNRHTVLLTFVDTRSLSQGGVTATGAWDAAFRPLMGNLVREAKLPAVEIPQAKSIEFAFGVNVVRLERVADGWVLAGERLHVSDSVSLAGQGLSIALLLPAVQAARTAARRMQAANNMREILLAMHNYADSHGALPAAYSANEQGKPLLSWRVHLLPFLDQLELYHQFHLDEPWDSEHNRKLIEKMPPVYRSPEGDVPKGFTTYLAVVGNDASIVPPRELPRQSYPTGTRFVEFLDGTSNTILLVDVTAQHAVPWTKPEDFPSDADNPLSRLRNWGGHTQVGLADGVVLPLPLNTSVQTFRALLTRGGLEPVRPPDQP